VKRFNRVTAPDANPAHRLRNTPGGGTPRPIPTTGKATAGASAIASPRHSYAYCLS